MVSRHRTATWNGGRARMRCATCNRELARLPSERVVLRTSWG